MRKRNIAAWVLAAGLVPLTGLAQPEPSAEEAVKRRQAVFETISFANSPIGPMARSGEINAEEAIKVYERIIVLSELIPDAFEVDTRGSDVETRALDSIWNQQEEFASLAAELASEARSAIEKINAGETDIRTIARTVGGKCGDCHDVFRAPE